MSLPASPPPFDGPPHDATIARVADTFVHDSRAKWEARPDISNLLAFPPRPLRWLFLDLNSYFASVEQQLDPALREDLARHRGALKLYRAQRWDEAEIEFFNLSQSGRPQRIYTLFIERIMYLREHPPGADWDGAFTFTHK